MTEQQSNADFECRGEYRYWRGDRNGDPEEAQLFLDHESLRMHAASGKLYQFFLDDFLTINPDNYRIQMSLATGETVELFNLGFTFEDFLREFMGRRNKVIIKQMLFHEKEREKFPGILYSSQRSDQREPLSGTCDLTLYETGLVVTPEKNELFRVPYADIMKITCEKYAAVIHLENRESLSFSMLGSRLDQLLRLLSEALTELTQKASLLVRQLLPEGSPTFLQESSFILREGHAASKKELDHLDPRFWQRLTEKILQTASSEQFKFLSSRATAKEITIGYKQGLLGDLTGAYLFMLFPLSASAAIALETVALEEESAESKSEADMETGRATYFFSLTEADACRADWILKSLQEINFRREPVYFDHSKLSEPRYRNYRKAVERLPLLRQLRERFIGRVMHRSPDQWLKECEQLLAQKPKKEK